MSEIQKPHWIFRGIQKRVSSTPPLPNPKFSLFKELSSEKKEGSQISPQQCRWNAG